MPAVSYNPDFTDKELEVCRVFWELLGDTNLILERLCITQSTYRTHLRNIYGKLGIIGDPVIFQNGKTQTVQFTIFLCRMYGVEKIEDLPKYMRENVDQSAVIRYAEKKEERRLRNRYFYRSEESK